jgi:tRNA-dihydrouridine synthase
MFTGSANWDEIAMVKEALSVPVIGNGDIETADDILRMKEHTDCDAIMVGRGSFGNPWIFREGRALLEGKPRPAPPTIEERFAVALAHARLALELQGDTKHTVVEFRKHFGWYTRGLPYGNELRQKLFAVESMTEAEAIFVRYVEERQLHVAGAA